MSGEEAGPEPAPRPAPLPPATEADTGRVAAGVFLLGCGLILLLAGGTCTALTVGTMFQLHDFTYGSATLFNPVAALAIGIAGVVFGSRLLRRRK